MTTEKLNEAIEHCKLKECCFSILHELRIFDVYAQAFIYCLQKENRPIFIFVSPKLNHKINEFIEQNPSFDEMCKKKYGQSLTFKIMPTRNFDKKLKSPILFSFDKQLNEPKVFIEYYE